MKTMLSLFFVAVFAVAAFGQAPDKPAAADKATIAVLKEKGAVGIFGRVLQKVDQGLLIDCRQGDYQVEFTYYGAVPATVEYGRIGTPTAGSIVLLRGYPGAKEVADDDWVRVVAFPAGNFEYQSTGGVGKTVHAFGVAPAK